jgi:hypothetical protein
VRKHIFRLLMACAISIALSQELRGPIEQVLNRSAIAPPFPDRRNTL